MARSSENVESNPRVTTTIRALGALTVVGVVLFFFFRTSATPPPREAIPTMSAAVVEPPPPPRCSAHGPERGVVIGKLTDDESEVIVLFSSEVSRGVALEAGFAVGVKHQIEGVMHAAVAVVDGEAKTLAIHNLAKSRGDVDAPLVVAEGKSWVGAALEPNASGMSVRLLRLRGDELQWGAEIEQGTDGSLAYDMAFGAEVGVIVWDDVTDKKPHGVVMFATVTVDSLEGGEDAQVVSRPEVDAEQPRVIRRPGGFWLSYVARARTAADSDAGAPEPEGRFRAERIEPSWLELVPLDKRGAPETTPSPVTSQDGFVLAYDLEAVGEGNALITWRDDDTPSGAHGGRVTSQLVTPSGAGNTQTISEENVGAGVPTLLAGWVAVPNDIAELELGPLGINGELESALRVEPRLHDGQLIASRDDVLLVARPAGQALRLFTVRCQR